MPTFAPRGPLRWACTIGCLCATATACGGCGPPLCPSTTFPAEIWVGLRPEAPVERDLLLTVSCPEEAAECGFLDGPVTGSATRSVMITTVLRPPEVQVVVTERTNGAVVLQARLPVDYQPRGPRQTDCGGDARALVWVPLAQLDQPA